MSDLRSSIEQLFEQNNQQTENTGRRAPFISREIILYKLMQLLDSNMAKDKEIATLREVIFAPN